MRKQKAAIYVMGLSALDRQAYIILLEHECKLPVAGESSFTPVSVWSAMRGRPDLMLVIADRLSTEVRDAVQMIPRLRKQTRILAVSAAIEPTQVQPWCDCGIDGYVLKDGGVEELRAALAAVLDGRKHFSDPVREMLIDGQSSASQRSTLSRRESELLPLLARGLTLREAASQMTVSYKTADWYRTSLLRKLGVRDRVELARYAIRERIIEP